MILPTSVRNCQLLRLLWRRDEIERAEVVARPSESGRRRARRKRAAAVVVAAKLAVGGVKRGVVAAKVHFVVVVKAGAGAVVAKDVLGAARVLRVVLRLRVELVARQTPPLVDRHHRPARPVEERRQRANVKVKVGRQRRGLVSSSSNL